MRLPAYGREIYEARRRGEHPSLLEIIFARQGWKYRGTRHCVAIDPEEYEPARIDWRICAGVPVDVIVRDGAELEWQGEPKYCWVAAETARWAARVLVIGPGASDGVIFDAEEIDDLAFAERRVDIATRTIEWPRWWPEDLRRGYAERRQQWDAERVAAKLGRDGIRGGNGVAGAQRAEPGAQRAWPAVAHGR